jgi:nitrite reductase/ring-hydroxylating ferredoxin subunit
LTDPTVIDAGPAHDIPVGTSKIIPYKALQIALFHTTAGFFAVKNDCPHAGEPLGNGTVQDGIVTCPGHSWQFDVTTGDCVRGEAACALRTYPTLLRDDHVMIEVG